MMQLSVLDQSPVREDGDASQALAETLELARHAESLGYARFWVSEHHSFNALAGSAPEVILGALGQTTSTIRIGSGGIMLPHYSAFKIAEVASLLACLFPGRVDLGLGRAPGTDMISARALAIDGQPRFEQFPQQIHALQEMLHNNSGHGTLGFRNYVDAASNEVQGINPHGSGPLGFYQGPRTAWIDS